MEEKQKHESYGLWTWIGLVGLTLADLAARTIAPPLELPIGVVTSFVGAILFVCIYYKVGRAAR